MRNPVLPEECGSFDPTPPISAIGARDCAGLQDGP